MGSGYFRTRYRDDMKIFQTRFVKSWMFLFAVSVLLLPLWASNYLLYLLNIAMIATIAALGLNILTGYTGQISLGHAAFFGIGAYCCGIMTSTLHVSFWIALPAAGLVAGFFGFLVGIPALRLKGLYLIMATMAFSFIVQHVFWNWDSLTKGHAGLPVPYPAIGTLVIKKDREFYYLILFITVLAVAFAKNLFRTRVGRAFIAIRDHEVAAKVIGIDLTRYKVSSFVVSSFYAGLAGGLYAPYITNITPEHFSLMLSIEYIVMIIVGGMGSILGSIYGAFFVTFLPEALKLLIEYLKQDPSVDRVIGGAFFDIRNAIYGLIIILFLIFEPKGLYGRWQGIKLYWTKWPYTY